jgi:hypothetical protein
MLSLVVVVESTPPPFPQVVDLLKEQGYTVRPVQSAQLGNADDVSPIVVLNVTTTPTAKEALLERVRKLSEDTLTLDLLRREEGTSSANAFLREPFTIAQLTRMIEFLAPTDGPPD